MPVHPAKIWGGRGKPIITTPQAQGWNLVFNDEFDGATLDRTKWVDTFFTRRYGQPDELQYFAPDAFVFDHGILKIRADTRNLGGRLYTSGVISSDTHFEFQYGLIEGRMKVPRGQGFWTAFWLGNYFDYHNPEEIDTVEVLGNSTDTARFHVHYPTAPNSDGQNFVGADLANDFHIFSVEWQANYIRWYLDGVQRFEVTTYNHIPHVPLFIMLNLSVGGSYPGAPDPTTPFPSYLEIDYVRVYQR